MGTRLPEPSVSFIMRDLVSYDIAPQAWHTIAADIFNKKIRLSLAGDILSSFLIKP